MNCPDISELISYALAPESEVYSDIAKHVLECPECRKNLEIVHETMLVGKWNNPKLPETGEEETKNDINAAVVSNAHNGVNGHLHTAIRDMRDRFGVISIPEGAQYLKEDDEVELATPGSINRFVANGYSFYSPGYQRKMSESKDCARKFMDEIDLNMNDLKGRLIPNCNLPWKQNIKPWALKYSKILTHELSPYENELWLESLEKCGAIPVPGKRTQRMNESIRCSNKFRAYDIMGSSVVFRVFAVFVTPVDATMGLEVANANVVGCIKAFAANWTRRRNVDEACCVCYTLCAAGGWNGHIQPSVSSEMITVLSQPDDESKTGWKVLSPLVDNMRPAFKSLVLALYPLSILTQQNLIQTWLFSRRFRTNNRFKASDVGEEFGIPELRVLEVFEILRKDKTQSWCADSEHASIYWEENGIKGKGFAGYDRQFNIIIISAIALVTALGNTCVALCNAIRTSVNDKGCTFGKALLMEITQWELWILCLFCFFVLWFLVEIIRNQLRRRLYN